MEDSILYTTTILALLIAVIIIFFVGSIVRYHRRYMKLQEERIQAEITIQENERKRIATDLHDSLGPLLSTVKLNINSIDVASPDDRVIVEKAGKHLDNIIASLRQISYNLLPNTLERKGLAEAVKEFTNLVLERNTLRIELHVIKTVQLAKEKEIHAFRIIQEIVHNTLKHAKAKTLQIGLGEEDKFLLILTKDDGVGFDVAKTKELSLGLGLKSLESRTDMLKGQLVIESEPGKGTNYFIKIPL